RSGRKGVEFSEQLDRLAITNAIVGCADPAKNDPARAAGTGVLENPLAADRDVTAPPRSVLLIFRTAGAPRLERHQTFAAWIRKLKQLHRHSVFMSSAYSP